MIVEGLGRLNLSIIFSAVWVYIHGLGVVLIAAFGDQRSVVTSGGYCRPLAIALLLREMSICL